MTRKFAAPKDTLPTVDVSVDFDFFVREEPLWDFGHSENGLFLHLAWATRYSSIDLYSETNPVVYADFQPTTEALKTALVSKNILTTPKGQAGVADSHSYAYSFFADARGGPPDALINIDAHHDIFDIHRPGVVDCSNWLAELIKKWPNTRFLQLYPKWKDAELDGPGAAAVAGRLEQLKWADWSGFTKQHKLRNLFICRSGAWVPPHLDPQFVGFVDGVGLWFRNKAYQLQPITKREFPTPEAAAQQRAEFRAQIEELNRRYREEHGDVRAKTGS